MAEATIRCGDWGLELEVSQFALIFALIRDLLDKECVKAKDIKGLGRLYEAVRTSNLDHDWYCVLKLDDYLTTDADYSEFENVVSCAIARIRTIGYGHGIPSSFYEGFEGANFSPPFAHGANWQAVAWPFMQVGMVSFLRTPASSRSAFLAVLGWVFYQR